LLRAIRHRQRWSSGFTLIEVLVALAVVAASLAAIGSLIATSVRGVRAVEQHVALVERARAIMAALPRRDELAIGQAAGESGGYRWQVTVLPYPAGQVGAASPWGAAHGRNHCPLSVGGCSAAAPRFGWSGGLPNETRAAM